MIRNSLKQMIRTPLRTALFFLLLFLAAAIVTLGADLLFTGSRNLREIEDSFTTIGTVQQRRTALKEMTRWNAGLQEEEAFQTAEYGEILPVDVLNFDGADYIVEPEKRPYYYANLSDLWIGTLEDHYLIAEVSPAEDCVPDHPVKLILYDVLYESEYSFLGEEEIYFCDHYNENPEMLYADRHYLMFLKSISLEHEGLEQKETGLSGLGMEQQLEYVPVSVEGYQYTKEGEKITSEDGVPAGYEEITDDFYGPDGHEELWQELISAIKRYSHVVPVGGTNSTNLLMAFYTGETYICQGRDITQEEYEKGERVCLISRDMVSDGDENGRNAWKVGGEITLPLYCANYESAPGYDFQDLGLSYPVWLNADGKAFPVFSEQTYRIVGVYDTLPGASLGAGYSMGFCEIVIPMKSVRESDANNIGAYGPMTAYNTSFQIENGTMDAFLEAWEKQGIDSLDITFYDGGYSQMRDGLEQMRRMGILLFLTGILTALLILLFFSRLLVGKQKMRMAVERAMGVSPAKCKRSMMAGILAIALCGSFAGSGMGTGVAFESVKHLGGEEFDTSYSSSRLRALQKETSVNTGWEIWVIGALSGSAMVLASYGVTSLEIRKNLRHEPLELFGEKRD